MTAKSLILLCTVALLALIDAAPGGVSDPAATPVQNLTNALLESMRAGSAEATTERYRKLEPVIEHAFDLPLVTRLAVGPEWTSFSPEQQKALIAAFSHFTIANYVHNFHAFDGERFEIDDVVSRGEDRIVRTRIIPAHDLPVNLLYRLREIDGAWRILDVYSNGVSELALRRSDFAAAIASGGAPALITHLNRMSDDLMK
jgi:phospholipid transport system substrate-binding protein